MTRDSRATAARSRLERRRERRVPRVGGADLAQPDLGDRPRTEVKHQTRARATAGDERVGKPQGIEELERSRLHGERPRLPCAIEGPIHNAEPRAKLHQLCCQGKTGWSRADNEDVDG